MEEFIIPVDIDTASLEAHLRRINELIDQIGARGTAASGDATLGVAEIRNLEQALVLAERLQSELARGNEGKFAFPVEQLQAATAEIGRLQQQMQTLRQELARPIQVGQGTLVSQTEGTRPAEPLVLQPTPGAAAAPRGPTSVQPGLVFGENPNLALQATPDTAAVATKKQRQQQILEALRKDQAAIEQQAAADLEGAKAAQSATASRKGRLTGDERDARDFVLDARQQVKDDYKAQAASLYDGLVQNDVLPLSSGLIGKKGQQGGAFSGGESFFQVESALANDTRFFSPTGRTPEELFPNLVGTESSDQLDGLLAQLRKIKELERAGNTDITRTGFNKTASPQVEGEIASVLQDQYALGAADAARLAPQFAFGGSANSVARQISPDLKAALDRRSSASLPLPVGPSDELGFPILAPTEAELLAQKAAAARNVAATASPDVAALEQLKIPTTSPSTIVDRTLEQAADAEKTLISSVRRKVEALDAQTKATNEAAAAERSLARSADKAATAKAAQADQLLRDTFPTQQANDDATKAATRAQKVFQAKQEATETLLNPTPGSVDEKNSALALARRQAAGGAPVPAFNDKLSETLEAQALQKKLAGSDEYARSVAETRVQYEKAAGNIASVLNENDRYAKVVARARTLQEQVAVRVQEQLAGMDQYVESLAQSKLLRQQEAARVQGVLAADTEYAAALAEEASARRAIAADVKANKLAGVGLENTSFANSAAPGATVEERRAVALQALQEEEAYNAAQEQVTKAEADLAAIKERSVVAAEREAAGLATVEQLQSETATLTRQYNAVQKKLVAEQERAAYNALPAGDPARGTRFQQFQSAIASRDGSFRRPDEFLQLGQFLQSRFLTTAGFAVSGIATYAAFAGLQNMLKSGQEFEKVTQQIRAEFDALGESKAFSGFRDQILQISRDTGESAQNVAQLALQFKGAFGQQFGNAGVLQQVKSAVELARVTGISLDEIQNSLTATAVTYGTTVQHIGDAVLTLQDRTGVSAKEAVQGLSNVAAVAQDMGFTVEQTIAIIDVAAKYTGQSASTAAEGLNRILPNITTKAPDVLTLFQQAAPQKVPQIEQALGAGDIATVFNSIGEIYPKLTKGQQDYIVSLVGGQRNAKVAIDIWNHYAEVLNDVNAAQNSNGRLAQSYAALQDTLAQQLAKVVTGLKDIGAALLQLGGSDVLQALAITIGTIVKTVGDALSIMTKLNDLTHGWAVRLLEVVAAIKLLQGFGTGNGLLGGLLAGLPGVGGRNVPPTRTINGTIAEQIAGPGSALAFGAPQRVSLTQGTGIQGPPQPRLITGTFNGEAATTFVPGVGAAEREATTALGRFGQGIASKTADSGRLISSAGASVGSALEGLGGAIQAAAPFLIIVGVTELITSAINSYNEGKKKLAAADQSVFHAFGGKDATSPIPASNQPPRLSPQDQAVKDAEDTFKKTREPGKGKNALVDILGAGPLGLVGGSPNPITAFKNVYRGLGALGDKTPAESAADAVQQETSKNFAQALTDNFTGPDLKSLVDQVNKQVDARQISGYGGKHLSVKDIREAAKNGTKDNKEWQTILKLFTDAADRKKNLGKAYQDLSQSDQATVNEQQKFEAGLTDLPTAQIQLTTGAISRGDFINKADALVQNTQRLLGDAIKNGADPQYIQQLGQELDKQTQARNQTIDAAVKGLEALGTDAALVGGKNQADTNKIKIDSATAALKLTPNAFLSPGSTDEARQIVKLQQDNQKNLAAHAKDALEAQRILETPIPLDPATITYLNVGHARDELTDPQHNALANAAAGLKNDDGSTKQFEDVLRMIAAANGDIKKVINDLIAQLQDRINKLKQLGGHDAEINADQGRIDALHGLLNDPTFLPTFLGSGATTKVPIDPPTREAQQAAKDAVAKALVQNNPVAAALEARNQALRDYLIAQKNYNDAKDPNIKANDLVDLQNKHAAYLSASDSYNNSLDAVTQSRQAVAASLANGDPVAQADAAISAAAQDMAIAKSKGDEAGFNQALAAYNNALFQKTQSLDAIAQAQASVVSAQAGANPVAQALAALNAANVQAATAHGKAAQLQALAAQITAQHGLKDALNQLASSQYDVVIAMLNAAGDTVGAAKKTLEKDYGDLLRYINANPGSNAQNDPNFNEKAAKVVTDQAAIRDSLLQKNENDIQFLLDTNQISTGQAISRLQNLLSSANITDQERQQIQREIYNLKQQITKDLQFNLPSDLKLPSLYEARRFTQTAGTGGYQDNRVININVNGTNMTPTQVVSTITSAINQPPRTGTRIGAY